MRKVLIAVDGSAHGWKAAEIVRELAACKPMDITVIHVVHDLSVYRPYGLGPTYEQQLDDVTHTRANQVMEKAKGVFADYGDGVVDYMIVNGEPANAIIDTAESGGFDTIVMGSRGMGRMAKLLVGSVSSKVVAHAPCSVFVIR